MFVVVFFLKTGTTLAFFHYEENFPFSKHDRKIVAIGLQIDSSQFFRDHELSLGQRKNRGKFTVVADRRRLPYKEVIKEFSLFFKVHDKFAIV